MAGAELFGAEERKEVQDVLDTGILFRYNHDEPRKGHWKARDFEREIANYTGARYAHAVSSGSTAVATAMAAVGIGAGDEVIVPPFTYIATVEGALLAGALPIFAEIDETLCLSPEGIRAAITPKTKAIVLVHMCGAMAKLDEIMEICKEHDLVLIEDTAQALGGYYKGRHLGTYGKVGAFSFDFFKIITAGEGGAIITNDEKVYDNAHQFSDHGHDHIGNNRGAEQHPILGFNFRISELHAAVGLAQIRKLRDIVSIQKRNKAVIKKTLSRYKGVSFRHIPDPEGDSATFLSFFLPDEDTARAMMDMFAEEGVSGAAYWYDNNFHYIKQWDHLRNMDVAARIPAQLSQLPQDFNTLKLPKTESIMSRMISLGIRVSWTEDELNDYCARIDKAMNRILNPVEA